MTKAQENSLDGTYTTMLRMVLGVSWKDKVSKKYLACPTWPQSGCVDGSMPGPCKERGFVVTQGRGSNTIRHGKFLELTLSTAQRWEHCRWLFTQTMDNSPQPACEHAFVLLLPFFFFFQCGTSLPSKGPMNRHSQPLRDSEKVFPSSKGH